MINRWLLFSSSCYFLAVAAIFLFSEISGGVFSLPVLALGLAIIALYGGLAVVLLARRDVDADQVRVFALLAVFITGTIVLPPIDPDFGPAWLYGALFLLRTMVYLVNPAVVVHMAALIPGPHRILKGRRWFLPSHYLALSALSVGLAAVTAFGAGGRNTFVTANLITYVYAGCAALILLGGAARREPVSRGRRQALMVFFGVLPWTVSMIARLILPLEIQARLPLDAVEKTVIFLVPVTMFIAIVGFRMFGLELLVRRGLIYGLTLGLPLVGLIGVWLGAGVVAGRFLGFEATPFQVGLILLLIGIILRPLGRWVTGEVDRMFFPEKIALRRLPRAVLGDMASSADLDEAAARLVERLRIELHVRSAALLTADEEGRFFRVRALSQEGEARDGAAEVVITAEDLKIRSELLQGRPVSRLALGVPQHSKENGTSGDPRDGGPSAGARGFCPERDGEAGSQETLGGGKREAHSPCKPASSIFPKGGWAAAAEILGADTVIPVSLGGPPTALICLGLPSAGGYFDRKDLDQLEILAEQAAAVIEHARVRELARMDPLTKLPRRQVALDRLNEELERGRRSGRPPAVALADIDDFKSVNDGYGHPTGDRALRAVSDAFRARARSMDLVARYGGEEMIVVLPECDAGGALAVCEEILRTVRKAVFRGDKDQRLSVTVSIGVAVAEPRDSTESLISRADEALYRAKRAGKDRACLAENPGK